MQPSSNSLFGARRTPLPHEGQRFVTDAGLETELIFHDGLELPHLISTTLLDRPAGRARLRDYYRAFVGLAEQHGMGVLLETPTWRISEDWATRIGYDRADRRRLNREAVALLATLRDESTIDRSRFVVSGNLGPRHDGYVANLRMKAGEAASYHAEQIADLAQADADAVSALTITTSAEALGIAQAANAEGIPVVISFTLESDGRLPSGEPLDEAIARVDEGAKVAYFGINCAHPTHVAPVVRHDGDWTRRIGALRANASKLSHAELDASSTLDDGDPVELAADYAALLAHLPSLRVFGGCCGTDIRHISRVCETLYPQPMASTSTG